MQSESRLGKKGCMSKGAEAKHLSKGGLLCAGEIMRRRSK